MMKNLILAVGILSSGSMGAVAFGSALTVRDIQLKGEGVVQIQLDGTAPKNSLEMDYVRDIVQFTIQNATIYPAKILHSEGKSEAFSKVFAYQYAPNLVRIRFNVDGVADQFKGKVKWAQNGKILTVSFPPAPITKKEESPSQESSLLAKVLGQKSEAKLESKSVPTVEKIESEESTRAPDTGSKLDLKKDRPLTGAGTKLGGAKSGPSVFRSFLAMFLVVGGLGLVLLYVKSKKNNGQANAIGNSWFAKMIPGSMKRPKALIEVIATHALGAKQNITVVRIRGQQFVLGVTQDSVQLITQLDADEGEVDVLDDPRVADSIGKIFGGKPQVIPTPKSSIAKAPTASKATVDLGASFNAMLKNSNGAGAIVARNAYQAQSNEHESKEARIAPRNVGIAPQSSVRDQIKQRLQGMKNV